MPVLDLGLVIAKVAVLENTATTYKLRIYTSGGFIDTPNLKGQDGSTFDVDDIIEQLSKEDLGLANVDNTSDEDKPVSTAQQKAIDEAIAEAKLAVQKWLPAVQTKTALPDPASITDRTITYLCRVTNDPTAANNGVWQLLTDGTAWTRYSDNLDFVDETELAAQMATVLPKAGGAMTGTLADPAAAQVRNIRYGTADLTAGSSSLTTGSVYFVYE
jgi:hypothetical protein